MVRFSMGSTAENVSDLRFVGYVILVVRHVFLVYVRDPAFLLNSVLILYQDRDPRLMELTWKALYRWVASVRKLN